MKHVDRGAGQAAGKQSWHITPLARAIGLAGLLLLAADPIGTATADEPPKRPVREIYAMNIDGTGVAKIAAVDDFPNIDSPAMSPDGKWLAVDGWTWDQTSRDSHVLVINLESGATEDLGPGAMPTWSSDGQWLAYSKYHPDGGVFIREIEGQTERLIDNAGWGIQWAPNGVHLAYTRGANLVVFDLRSNAGREAFPPGESPYQQIYWNFEWSPDSKRICFKGRRNKDASEIAIVSATGGEPRLKVICEAQELREDLAWHPDGTRIVLPRVPNDEQPRQLYEFSPDRDGPPRRVAGQPTDRNNGGVCFSRDGKRLIFSSHK